jgi:hypothetical protein
MDCTATSQADVWLEFGCCCIAHSIRWPAWLRVDPAVVIMDGQSAKTAEQGGIRGFDGHQRLKGQKRNILVDISAFRSPAALNEPICRTDGWSLQIP